MYARLTTTVVGPAEDDSAAEIFEQVMPTMRELDGYRGLVVLSDLDEGRFLVLTLWETAEAMEASEAITARIKAAETAKRDFEIESTTRYRVDTFDLAR
jgi:heme-degrading monooxygenase HmoA